MSGFEHPTTLEAVCHEATLNAVRVGGLAELHARIAALSGDIDTRIRHAHRLVLELGAEAIIECSKERYVRGAITLAEHEQVVHQALTIAMPR